MIIYNKRLEDNNKNINKQDYIEETTNLLKSFVRFKNIFDVARAKVKTSKDQEIYEEYKTYVEKLEHRLNKKKERSNNDLNKMYKKFIKVRTRCLEYIQSIYQKQLTDFQKIKDKIQSDDSYVSGIDQNIAQCEEEYKKISEFISERVNGNKIIENNIKRAKKIQSIDSKSPSYNDEVTKMFKPTPIKGYYGIQEEAFDPSKIKLNEKILEYQNEIKNGEDYINKCKTQLTRIQTNIDEQKRL